MWEVSVQENQRGRLFSFIAAQFIGYVTVRCTAVRETPESEKAANENDDFQLMMTRAPYLQHLLPGLIRLDQQLAEPGSESSTSAQRIRGRRHQLSHEENALLQALDTADLLAQERHLDNVEVLWQESCGQDD